MKKEKLNCGFIGFGKQAREYAKVFKKLNINIDSICVRKKNKYSYDKKFFKIKNIFSNLKEISSKKFNFLMVALPWYEIEKKLPRIIQENKTRLIFVEKPVALSKSKLESLIEQKKKYKKKIFVLYNRRFLKTSVYLKKIINKQRPIGFNMRISEREKEIIKLLSKKIKGNIKYHVTSHWIDLVMWLFNLKKFNLKKKNNIYYLTSGSRFSITIDYLGLHPVLSQIVFNNQSIYHHSLEKLYHYRKGKKFLIISEDNKYKPGLISLSKEIKNIVKGKKKSDLPRIENLKNLYDVLSKIIK